MADEKKRYPVISTKHWHSVRRKFRSALPKEVTTSYLASLLNMTPDSARANVLAGLKLAGIVDQDNKPTERANRWRDDAQYPQVCEEIRQEVYDQELLDLAHDTSADRGSVQKWFANRAKVGEDASRKFASFYLMLLKADLSDETEGSTPTRVVGNQKTKPRLASKPTAKSSTENDTSSSNDVDSKIPSPELQPARFVSVEQSRRQPSLHINIQIHISSDSSAEQIDQIFASMAKHLRDFT